MTGDTVFSQQPGMKRAIALAAAALVAVCLPAEGGIQWLRFAAAVGFTAGAVLAHPRGFAYAGLSLFAAAAVKDGILVVKELPVNVMHVILIGTLLAALARAIDQDTFHLPRLDAFEWAMLAPFAAGIWSLGASVEPAATVLYSFRLLLLWAFAVVVSRTLREPGMPRKALMGFVGASVVLGGIAILQYLVPEIGIGTIDRWWLDTVNSSVRPAGFYLDPNFLGMHLALAALAALALTDSSSRKMALVLASAFLMATVALSYSRSAWLSTAVGFVVLAIMGGRYLRTVTIGVVAVAIAGGMLLLGPAMLVERVVSVADPTSSYSTMTRVLMARSSIEMIKDRPIFGTGLEAYDKVYPEYRLLGSDKHIKHPHQVPLALVAETGVGGAAALLALVVTGVITLRRLRGGDSGVKVALVACVVALVVGSLFQFLLYYEPAWLLGGLIAAAAAAARAESAAAAPATALAESDASAPAAVLVESETHSLS